MDCRGCLAATFSNRGLDPRWYQLFLERSGRRRAAPNCRGSTRDCPAAWWNSLNTAKIGKEYGAREVFKNGPHFWVSDTLTLELGETLDFEGQKARYVCTLPAAIMEGKSGSGGMAEPYKVFNPKKSGAFSYFKGKPVYELVDPEGNVYVMQAGSQVVDPSLTLESLAAPGWKYRVRTLDKDLVFDLPKGTVVDAVSDDLRISITVFRGPRNETGISPKCRPE